MVSWLPAFQSYHQRVNGYFENLAQERICRLTAYDSPTILPLHMHGTLRSPNPPKHIKLMLTFRAHYVPRHCHGTLAPIRSGKRLALMWSGIPEKIARIMKVSPASAVNTSSPSSESLYRLLTTNLDTSRNSTDKNSACTWLDVD